MNQKTGPVPPVSLISPFTSYVSRPLKAECFLHEKRVSFETEGSVKTNRQYQE